MLLNFFPGLLLILTGIISVIITTWQKNLSVMLLEKNFFLSTLVKTGHKSQYNFTKIMCY